MKFSNINFKKAQNWIYRNARPIDFARWKYHFQNGNPNDVVDILLAYQNDDGGFGKALEPDNWNHNSSPITTSTAALILKEIKFTDKNHPIIKGMLDYFENTNDFTGEYWRFSIKSNDNYPHAPWWTYDSNWNYNPTAIVVGFILTYANENTIIYKKANELNKKVIKKFLSNDFFDKSYCEEELNCYIYYIEYLENLDFSMKDKLKDLKINIKKLTDKYIERDEIKWNNYCSKPSKFIFSPKSFFCEGNQEIINIELDYIINNQNDDGSWNINWSWNGNHQKEFTISENWWKSSIVISNLLLLKIFGRFKIK